MTSLYDIMIHWQEVMGPMGWENFRQTPDLVVPGKTCSADPNILCVSDYSVKNRATIELKVGPFLPNNRKRIVPLTLGSVLNLIDSFTKFTKKGVERSACDPKIMSLGNILRDLLVMAGLRSTPWWDAADVPIAKVLEEVGFPPLFLRFAKELQKLPPFPCIY